jgi:DNA transposition AAA+ family ATPase
MHPHSLPPSDRDEAAESTEPQAAERAVRPHNPAIRARLQAYRADTKTTNRDLGRRIGVSSSVISQYLLPEGMRYTGLIDELEAKIETFFSSMAIRETASAEVQDTISTEVGEDVLAAINRAIKTESVIIISGPAGCGKTHMLGGFAAKHPSALLITIDELNGSVYGIEREVANQLPPKGASDYARLFDFAVAKLKNSGRLLMVDNAHKLKTTGFSILFDLADKTGIPVLR